MPEKTRDLRCYASQTNWRLLIGRDSVALPGGGRLDSCVQLPGGAGFRTALPDRGSGLDDFSGSDSGWHRLASQEGQCWLADSLVRVHHD